MPEKDFLSEISKEGASPYILHKIWFGDSFLTRDEVKQNLIEASLEIDLASPDHKFKKIIWTDHDANEEEKAFATKNGYEIINLKNLKDAEKLPEFGANFFRHTTKEGKEYDFLPYIFPEPEELFPDYGRRSDFARALIIKRFGGLYEDTDDILIPRILSGLDSHDKRVNFLKEEIKKEEIKNINPDDNEESFFDDLFKKDSDFMVNQNANSIIFARKASSEQINQVCNRICEGIDKGYEELVRKRNYADLSGLKRHQKHTVALSGPESYKDFNQHYSDLPFVFSGSWLGKGIFDMTDKLKAKNLKIDEIKERLVGQLTIDARNKLGILNLAKYVYVVKELTGENEDDAKVMVDEAFEKVKADFTEWQPRELRSLDQDNLNLYEARKIYKYQTNITDSQRENFVKIASKYPKIASKYPLNYPELISLIKSSLKKQDHKTFNKLLELKSWLIDIHNGGDIESLVELILCSSDEIYNSYLQFVKDNDRKIDTVTNQLKKDPRFNQSSSSSDSEEGVKKIVKVYNYCILNQFGKIIQLTPKNDQNEYKSTIGYDEILSDQAILSYDQARDYLKAINKGKENLFPEKMHIKGSEQRSNLMQNTSQNNQSAEVSQTPCQIHF